MSYDRIRELEAALGGLLATFKSHVDGRDLLNEIHPRSRIDIIVRRDGRDLSYEGDWLSNVRDAAINARIVLGETDTPPLPTWPRLDFVPRDEEVYGEPGEANCQPESPGPA